MVNIHDITRDNTVIFQLMREGVSSVMPAVIPSGQFHRLPRHVTTKSNYMKNLARELAYIKNVGKHHGVT